MPTHGLIRYDNHQQSIACTGAGGPAGYEINVNFRRPVMGVFRPMTIFPHESKYCRWLIFDEEEEYLDYIDQLSEQLARNSSDTFARNNRGVAYAELGQFANAVTDFVSACETATDNTPFLNLAEVIAERGDLKQAIALATRAIDITPQDSAAYAVRAGLYAKDNQPSNAQQDRDHSHKLRKV
ncbi:MAG: tetratricopeptide repeat protein [Pirellulales bacterium]